MFYKVRYRKYPNLIFLIIVILVPSPTIDSTLNSAFLTSSISDDLIYNFLNEVVTSDFNKQFNYYPICVICVIIFSYLLSYILDIIYKALYKLIIKIIHIYK